MASPRPKRNPQKQTVFGRHRVLPQQVKIAHDVLYPKRTPINYKSKLKEMKDDGLVRKKKGVVDHETIKHQFTGMGYFFWMLRTAGPPGIEKLTAKRYKQYSRQLTRWAQDVVLNSSLEKSFETEKGIKKFVPLHRNPRVVSQILRGYRRELVSQKERILEKQKKHAYLSPDYEKLGQIVHRLNLWISVVKHTADELRTRRLPIY